MSDIQYFCWDDIVNNVSKRIIDSYHCITVFLYQIKSTLALPFREVLQMSQICLCCCYFNYIFDISRSSYLHLDFVF